MSVQSILEQLLKKSDSDLGKFGAGAAAGSVLGLLLGSKRGRSMGGSALNYGSIAALGVVAFKAYQTR
jgi:uncharacterized membrane protein YebE (DUF533 family)